jgi:hypothetical protein
MRRLTSIAKVLQDHFGSLASDSGFRSTFRSGHTHTHGSGFSREDVMDEEWRARMQWHAKVEKALAKIEAPFRETIYRAFGTERWPEPLQSVFWWKHVNASLAGVVLGLEMVQKAAQATSSRSASAWIRKSIRQPQMRGPLQFLLRRAELETRVALESFLEAWEEEKS